MPSTPHGRGEQLFYTVNEARDVLRIGRTKIYELMSDGRLPFLMLDGRRRIRGEDVRQLPVAQGAEPTRGTVPRRGEDKDDPTPGPRGSSPEARARRRSGSAPNHSPNHSPNHARTRPAGVNGGLRPRHRTGR